MKPDSPHRPTEPVDLSEIVSGLEGELRCLLGPGVQLTTSRLSTGGPVVVQAQREDLVDLLRHLALDAHDAMPRGGTVTIRTGHLNEVPQCATLVLHEVPNATKTAAAGSHRRKGRSLGLSASYETIERAGGHFHVSCRGRETVLTICFPLAA